MAVDDMDALAFLLFLAVDAGYSLATHGRPLPLADPGQERMLAEAVASYVRRMGLDLDERPPRVPAWLQAQIAKKEQVT